MADDFEFFGIDDEAQRTQWADAKKYQLWPENESAFRFFIALEFQWRVVAGFGFISHLGLDYGAVHSAMKMMGIDRAQWPDLFADVRVMDKAALSVFNAKETS